MIAPIPYLFPAVTFVTVKHLNFFMKKEPDIYRSQWKCF